MAAIGPVVESIQNDVPLSFIQVSLLTTLPVIAMGLGCFANGVIVRRMGMSGVITLALITIAASDALHWAGLGFVGLWVAALGAGMGIAFIQATLPGFIKHVAGDKTALVMGVYVASIMAGAALAASLTPVINHFLSWQTGLAAWCLVALVALYFWLRRDQTLSTPSQAENKQLSFDEIVRIPRFWTLAIFFGLGTAGYTCLLAWLPPTFSGLGWPPARAGFMLSWLSAVEVVAALTFPALSHRMGDRRPVLILVLMLSIVGFVLLSQWPIQTAWLSTTLLGLGIGGLFPMSLIITMDHIDNPVAAGQLTAWVQGIGYLIASISPFVAGAMKDVLGGFDQAWLLLGVIFTGLVFMSLQFNRAGMTRHMNAVTV
ncbi:MFS transporter [Larsenimonas sp. GH2-1]|uniref:MFS transporter n=2 Tax=Larsenimonas rhizosphaerae TaxID=2944682 RepID=A0AA41ZH35_9GAMM|nr:MFS transporter [Larsenimonas rhizosphaerae]